MLPYVVLSYMCDAREVKRRKAGRSCDELGLVTRRGFFFPVELHLFLYLLTVFFKKLVTVGMLES